MGYMRLYCYLPGALCPSGFRSLTSDLRSLWMLFNRPFLMRFLSFYAPIGTIYAEITLKHFYYVTDLYLKWAN